jgi:hypothetical protein
MAEPLTRQRPAPCQIAQPHEHPFGLRQIRRRDRFGMPSARTSARSLAAEAGDPVTTT